MAAKTRSLKFKRKIAAPAAEVYRAWTHSTALRDWFADAARVEARPNGPVYFGWNEGYAATGHYTKLTPGKEVAFTWNGQGEPASTKVNVRLAERDGKTTVNLTHSGLGGGKAWANALKEMQAGWESGLENLQSVLETGTDLRQARVPRLGIFIDEFNPEVAERLGVPVSQGIRVAGTADESGARAAGLQPNDVIVSLGGKKVTDFASLRRSLQGRQGGDVVPVVYYRGAEKHKVQMMLSRRPPNPEPPATAAALAELARANQAQVLADFETRLAGVSEAEAERRPAANEWNAKQLVAHFIACERDLQSWVADMLNDNAVPDSLEFRPNATARLDAIVTRYPTLPALLGELKAAGDETANLLAALPPEFLARRHMYDRIASWIMFVTPSHLRDEHANQLQATLDAARQAAGETA